MTLIVSCAVSLPLRACEIKPDSEGQVDAVASSWRSSRGSSKKMRPRAASTSALCSLHVHHSPDLL